MADPKTTPLTPRENLLELIHHHRDEIDGLLALVATLDIRWEPSHWEGGSMSAQPPMLHMREVRGGDAADQDMLREAKTHLLSGFALLEASLRKPKGFMTAPADGVTR